MRFIVLAIAALTLNACADERAAAAGCAREARHEVAWTSEATPDTITAQSDGPSCAQAVVLLVIRDARGDPLWTFASTYYDMVAGGVAPENAPPIPPEDVERFLAGWADVTAMRSNDLPEWRENAARPGEDEPLAYETPFERETYEALRGRALPAVCYAAAVEATHCLVIDPASHAPAVIVAYGP
jgi:hypothetical protein